jgi:nitroreductase
MDTYSASTRTTRAALVADADARELVRFATLAANSHNTQPWKFHLAPSRTEILPDFSRRTPIVDPDDHHLFASLGCAAENLVLAAAATWWRGESLYDAGAERIVINLTRSSPDASVLFEAIPHRQSTRAEYDPRQVDPVQLTTLMDAARVPGVDVVMLTDRPRIEQVLELVVAGNTAQIANPAFVRELKHWIRFNPREALTTGDGLFAGATGNPAMPSWLGRLLFKFVYRAPGENDKYARAIRSSAGVVVFAGEKADKEHWVRVGRSSQRFALQATSLGLKHAFINQPVEVTPLRPPLAAVAGLERRPDLVMRFGYGRDLPFSPRRPVEAVIT